MEQEATTKHAKFNQKHDDNNNNGNNNNNDGGDNDDDKNGNYESIDNSSDDDGGNNDNNEDYKFTNNDVKNEDDKYDGEDKRDGDEELNDACNNKDENKKDRYRKPYERNKNRCKSYHEPTSKAPLAASGPSLRIMVHYWDTLGDSWFLSKLGSIKWDPPGWYNVNMGQVYYPGVCLKRQDKKRRVEICTSDFVCFKDAARESGRCSKRRSFL